MLISGGAALLNLGLTQLNAPVVAHASESSNVSTWDGTTLAEPTQSVIMGGQTFYVVRTASQLAYLRSTGSLSNNYILVNDIDLASHDWSPICVSKAASDSSQSNTSSFNGVLDGNGHTIKNFKLAGTTSQHVDYNPSGDVSKDSHKASVVGFVGQVGSNGVVKNLNFTGSQTEAAVGAYCYYWFNGAIIGRNFGTVRNISADSIKLRTEGYGYKSTVAFYTYVQDAGMGVLCGRNEGTIAFTSIKNSQLDVVGNSQITYTSWGKTYYFQLTHMRYGQNAGYINNYSASTYHDNYYYKTTLNKSFTNVTEDSNQLDTHSVEVTSSTGFSIPDSPKATSSLTDNFVPFDPTGTIYQNQTSKSLDKAISLLGADCATCTAAYIQSCINDYNIDSASKNVYENITASQSYNGNSVTMSAFDKLKEYAKRYNLNVYTKASSASLITSSSSNSSVIALGILATIACLSAGAYVTLKRKDA